MSRKQRRTIQFRGRQGHNTEEAEVAGVQVGGEYEGAVSEERAEALLAEVARMQKVSEDAARLVEEPIPCVDCSDGEGEEDEDEDEDEDEEEETTSCHALPRVRSSSCLSRSSEDVPILRRVLSSPSLLSLSGTSAPSLMTLPEGMFFSLHVVLLETRII